MKRFLSILLILILSLSFCACGITTPETLPAGQSAEAPSDSVSAGEEPVKSGEEPVNAEFSTDDGLIQVRIRSQEAVSLPETMPVLRIKPKTITIQALQQIAQAVFGDAQLYEYSEEMSREELLECIAAMEKGVTDEAIKASHGENISDADLESIRQARLEMLEYYRNAYANASDAPSPPPCQWKFWPMEHYALHDYAGTDPSYTDDIPYGVQADLRATVTMDGIPYQLWASNYEREGFCNHSVSIYLNAPQGMADPNSAQYKSWVEGLGLCAQEAATGQELDAALTKAAGLLRDMGLGDWQLKAESCIGYNYNNSWQIAVEGQPIYAGYPVVRQDAIKDVRDSPFYCQDYYFESVRLVFTNDGRLLEMKYQGAAEVVEVVEEAASLTGAVELRQLVSGTMHGWKYSDLFVYTADQTMNTFGDLKVEIGQCGADINAITVGFARKETEGTDYLLVPVISFRGELQVTGTIEGFSESSMDLMMFDDSGEHALLMIDLTTGSVI
ncbi:MAG: hypothetical protein SPE18_09120 [Candidatus Limivicinus sp.]|nr:hypothetical protein [Candidatus Limivicinus sp.]